MHFVLRLIPAAAATCLLASCGGGGGGVVPVPPPAATGGVAVDGYLVGSTVLCDSNGNGAADAGELSVGTDAMGKFSFATGCTSALVLVGGASADTGLPFTGRLQAPAGSTVLSPLTTLVSGGVPAATLLAALGLPADTALLSTDPALISNGALVNPALLKATLAVQQVVQKLGEVFTGLGGVSGHSAAQAVYAEVAAAVAASLPTAGLLSNGSAVDDAVVARLAQAAAERVRAASGLPAGVAAALQAVNTESLAAVVAGALAVQAEALLQAAPADVVAATSAQQQDSRIAAFVADNRAALAGPPSAATAVLAQALTDTVAGVEAPTNYLALASDSLSVQTGNSRQTLTTAQFQSAAGASLVWPVAPTATLTVDLKEVGNYVLPADMKLTAAVSIVDTQANGQGTLQGVISHVTVQKTADGLKITVPALSQAVVYGVSADGRKTAVVDFANSVAGISHTLRTAAGSSNSIVFGEVIDYAVQRLGQDFTGIAALRGTYRVSVVIQGLPLRQTDGTALPAVTVTVPTAINAAGQVTASQSVAGPGLVGLVTLTD